jgi:5-methylcytosine-specific restriction enzyme A
MRNPKWHRDEIILALDLYYTLKSGEMNASNPKVIELSEILNRLPIHKSRPDQEKFRNANGVNLKLGNFKHFDPDYPGEGLKGGSKLDEVVLNEFYGKRDLLKTIANQIKITVQNTSVVEQLYSISNEEDESLHSVKEGKVIYKLHKLRERDSTINKKKKEIHFKLHGKLNCEVCDFDFYKVYGELGKGFIEAHHRVPLSNLVGASKTELKDLALVCSNCHRMLHREINTLTVNELKSRINQ